MLQNPLLNTLSGSNINAAYLLIKHQALEYTHFLPDL